MPVEHFDNIRPEQMKAALPIFLVPSYPFNRSLARSIAGPGPVVQDVLCAIARANVHANVRANVQDARNTYARRSIVQLLP